VYVQRCLAAKATNNPGQKVNSEMNFVNISIYHTIALACATFKHDPPRL